MARRPEHLAPPEIFYNFEEARKYTKNTRMIEIQNEMSERAVELLALPEDEPCFVLDIGCGSGILFDQFFKACKSIIFPNLFFLGLKVHFIFLCRSFWRMFR